MATRVDNTPEIIKAVMRQKSKELFEKHARESRDFANAVNASGEAHVITEAIIDRGEGVMEAYLTYSIFTVIEATYDGKSDPREYVTASRNALVEAMGKFDDDTASMLQHVADTLRTLAQAKVVEILDGLLGTSK